MDTHILPYMVQPIRLIDFLKDSYDVGGVVSLLALHGLFILITKHNLYVIRLLPRCWVGSLVGSHVTNHIHL
jgi:U3 small nucleolar RNA-associated protein 19